LFTGNGFSRELIVFNEVRSSNGAVQVRYEGATVAFWTPAAALVALDAETEEFLTSVRAAQRLENWP
jgi:hypothetical protein